MTEVPIRLSAKIKQGERELGFIISSNLPLAMHKGKYDIVKKKFRW